MKPGDKRAMTGAITKRRGIQLLQRMRGRRLAVLGDWMLDRYVWGTANRISPEAPVPVVDFVDESDRLGGAGNVAANLVALGARVEGFGAIGKDEAGAALKRRLREMHLQEKGIVEVPGRRTTLKTRIIAGHQQVVRMDREVRTRLPDHAEEHLVKQIFASLGGLDALVISDYEKGVVSDSLAEKVLGACAKRKISSFAGPKRLSSRLPAYRGATVVICNRAEAGFLVAHALDSEESIRDAGQKLLEHFACSAMVITLGAQGLILFERGDQDGFHVPAIGQERRIGIGKALSTEGREVFDVTGAGDTVLATMALAAAAGASLREAAVFGNAAAGVVVAKLGTATLTRDELASVLNETVARK
jgi:rfaE bifunctional protein kinase chain/domain